MSHIVTTKACIGVVLGFGFLASAAAGQTCAGDMNDDGFVDLADVGPFVACAGGPGVPLEPGCEPADLDADNDSDLADFAAFQVAFGTNRNDPREGKGDITD